MILKHNYLHGLKAFNNYQKWCIQECNSNYHIQIINYSNIN